MAPWVRPSVNTNSYDPPDYQGSRRPKADESAEWLLIKRDAPWRAVSVAAVTRIL